MVYTPSGNTTVMQSKPLYISVDATPDAFNWGVPPRDGSPPLRQARPSCIERAIAGRTLYQFGWDDSMAIWMEARKYEPKNIKESYK